MKQILPALLLSAFLLTGCASLVTDDTPGQQDTIPAAELMRAGEVESSLCSWNWLFLTSAEQRRAALEDLALLAAREEYGPDAKIRVESVSGRWSPASLLMLFGGAGFVEDAGITASVWLPAPPPAEPEPEVRTVLRYSVLPAAEYTSNTEFTTVEYRPRAELEAELKEALENGKLSGEDFEKKLGRLPETGRIDITYGRSDLTNAISRWFTFSLSYDGKRIFRKRGIEDIPYVYGNDKLWWNDRSYGLDLDWEGRLELEIEDKYQDKIYFFSIIREVCILEE